MIIMGIDEDGKAYPIRLDSNRNLIVALESNPFYIFTGRISSFTVYLSAGLNVATMLTVPVGHRYIVNNVSLRYSGTVATVTMFFAVRRGSSEIYLYNVITPVNGQIYDRQFRFTLEAGDELFYRIVNATLNDLLQAGILYDDITI